MRRVRLTADVHSLPLEVSLKIFTLHTKLPTVTYLEANKFPPTD